MNVLWIGLGAITALIICNWGCACCTHILQWLRLNPDWLRLNPDWLRRFRHDPRGQLQPQQMQLVAQGPAAGGTRSQPSEVGSPAPTGRGAYRSPDPPPYSAEDYLDSWSVRFRHAIEESSEDDVVILSPPPIPPRPGPVHAVGPTLEEETTVEPPLEEEGETTS